MKSIEDKTNIKEKGDHITKYEKSVEILKIAVAVICSTPISEVPELEYEILKLK